MSKLIRPMNSSLPVLMGGVVAIVSLLPVARRLSLIYATGESTPLVMMGEAFLCLLMLAGKIRFRMAGRDARQASALAAALHAGRLE